MKNRRIKNPNSISWILVLIVIVLSYATYYLVYIPQQEAKLKERGFRILKEYAQNIHDKHEYYKTHLKNYAAYYSINSTFGKDNYYKEFHKRNKLKARDSILINEILAVADNLNKTIKIDKSIPTSPSFFSTNHAINSDSITFDLEENYFDTINNIALFKNNNIQFSDKKARMPVSTLMEGLKFDKLFANISFLDRANILYNSNGNVVDDLTQTNNLLDTLSHQLGGIILELEINSVKNQVMVLPIKFLDQEFYLAGFIPDKEFKKKTRTINSQFLTIIAGLLLLMLLGMPILKIIFVNPKERLNVQDAHLATLSLILSLSLLMLLFIGTVKYYVIDKKEVGNRIEKLSKKLVENVEKDFKTLLNLGDSIVSGGSEKDEFAASIRKILNQSLNDTINGEIIKNISKYDTIPQKLLNENFPINEVILINSKGLAVKAATSTVFSNLVPLDLSNRMYFQTHANSESWDFTRDFAKKIYIESIKSYNSGNQETAISFCLNNDSVFSSKAQYLAITSHIPSLYDQVLPEDVRYVVIDKKGKVLFHSDPSKNLHENFLIESKNNPMLKAAIAFRTTENATISYNEKEWFVRIVPLKNKPLFHITLIDLQQADAKNTKIYLFTFYFLLFSFLCTWGGMQIIQKIKPKESFMDTKTWPFKWLMFHPYKIKFYKRLAIVQGILFIYQVLGFFYIDKPVEMLVYQLVFIAYSGFAAISVLGNKKHNKAILIVSLAIVLLLIALYLVNTESKVFISMLILAVLTIYLFLTHEKNIKTKSDPKKTQLIYRIYMFSWLISLSVLPVFSYYKTIDLQEEKLVEKGKMMYVASQNLHLKEHYRNYKKMDWYNRITCDNTDELLVLENWPQITHKSYLLQRADSIYAVLPGLNYGNNLLTPLLKKQNKQKEWSAFDDSSISYSAAETESTITVVSKNLEELNAGSGAIWPSISNGKFWYWLLVLFIPLVLFIVLVWILFKYLADIVLNTVLADWRIPNTPKWKTLIDPNPKNTVNRILLVSTQSNKYLKTTSSLYETRQISVNEILKPKFNASSLELKTDEKIIWIKNLEMEILRIENYDRIIDNLREIEKIAGERKMIIETPIDTDFISEYFDDYIEEYQVEKEEETKIFRSTRKLRIFLKEYCRYTGRIDRKSILSVFKNLKTQNKNEQNLLANAHLMKLQYNYIWNNLNAMEKMILFDLADDGMLNTKNKFLINRLKTKGLINLKPYPKIFTPSFKYFLKFSISPDEAKHLENRLRKHGQWKNTKYLLLLILIPLAALVFISQGTSIEKIIGIFTGVVALFSGAMRLMDTNLFGTKAK